LLPSGTKNYFVSLYFFAGPNLWNFSLSGHRKTRPSIAINPEIIINIVHEVQASTPTTTEKDVKLIIKQILQREFQIYLLNESKKSPHSFDVDPSTRGFTL
jgi:hypothetical protein